MGIAVELRFQLFAGTAGSVAVRAAGLSHKTVDNPVKLQAVIKFGAGKFLNPFDVFGRIFRIHLNHDIAVFEFQEQSVFGVFDLVSVFDFFGSGSADANFFGFSGL